MRDLIYITEDDAEFIIDALHDAIFVLDDLNSDFAVAFACGDVLERMQKSLTEVLGRLGAEDEED